MGAEISQGCLLTMHKNHGIKMYSLSSAKLSMVPLYEDSVFQLFIISIVPFQSQEPPVLFVITSYHHQMFMGANPFYILSAEQYNKFWVLVAIRANFAGHLSFRNMISNR